MSAEPLRGVWPATVQSRAAYSSANTITERMVTAENNTPNCASSSGTEARIIAATSSTMTPMMIWMKRDPAE